MKKEITRVEIICDKFDVEKIKSKIKHLELPEDSNISFCIDLDWDEEFPELWSLYKEGTIIDFSEKERYEVEVPEEESREDQKLRLDLSNHPGNYSMSLLDAFLEINAAWFVFKSSPAICIGTELWYYRVQQQLECLPIINIHKIPSEYEKDMKLIPLEEFWKESLGDIMKEAIQNKPSTLGNLIENVYEVLGRSN